jgi:acyl dehydratase
MSFAFPTPPAPEVPGEHASSATWEPRYEDAAMDGRLNVLALPPAIGASVWRPILTGHPGMRAVHRQGVVPILTRLVVGATEAMIRIDRSLHGGGRFQVARAPDGDRLYLNIWVDVDGTAGRLIPPVPAGERVRAGRVFAEHVFTRPFGPPDQRKVTRLEVEGFPAVPEVVYAPAAAKTAADAPDGARWLDDAAVPDPGWTVFGLDHTDANQHVNSLVYIRMATEAALRRLDAHGTRGRLLARAVELTYRKPCFAGDRVRVALRAFDHDGVLGAAGTVVADGDPADKPRAYARVLFA